MVPNLSLSYQTFLVWMLVMSCSNIHTKAHFEKHVNITTIINLLSKIVLGFILVVTSRVVSMRTTSPGHLSSLYLKFWDAWLRFRSILWRNKSQLMVNMVNTISYLLLAFKDIELDAIHRKPWHCEPVAQYKEDELTLWTWYAFHKFLKLQITHYQISQIQGLQELYSRTWNCQDNGHCNILHYIIVFFWLH